MRITADVIDEEPRLECNTKKKSGQHLSIVLKESTKASSETSEKLVDSMLKQFQNLSIKFIPNTLKTDTVIGDADWKVLKSKLRMDPEKDSNEPQKYENCCISYAEKMKEEIKKEVIDEVLKILRESQPPPCSFTPVSNKVVHPGIFCDHCDQQICGVRYKCGNCEDYDLCEDCEKIPGIHSYRHVFLKLRYPFSLCVDDEPKSDTEACMVRNENGSYVFRPKSAPAKVHKEMGFMKKTLEKPLEFNAKFLYHETIGDGEVISAGKPFLKKWRVANTGLTSWEKDVVVARLCGSDELIPDTTSITAPPLKPGEEGFVIVYFTAPRSEGNFACYWQFRHQGKHPFGDTLWCHIRVGLHSPKISHFAPSSTMQQKFSSSKTFFGDQVHCLMKSRRKAKEERKKRKESRKKEVKQIFDVLTAVQEEQGCRRPKSESLKPIVTSHTATPNNTPFDLSPPKSPEPQEFIEVKTDAIISYVDTGLSDGEKVEQKVNVVTTWNDEPLNFNSISSSESDSEFVVIPMPKCFSVLENVTVSQAAASQAADIARNNLNEDDAPVISEMNQSPSKPPGNPEQVSQETGAPEEAEYFNINREVQVKEMSVRRKEIAKSGYRLNFSPSSSSVSVIESEDNMSPSAPSAPPIDVAEPQEHPTETVSTHVLANENVSAVVQDNQSPQNCTFPKFPLDTEDSPVYATMSSSSSSANTESTSVSTPSPVHNSNEQHTVQVLPEGLVTGALIAAASVYNNTKAFISRMQPGKNEQDKNTQRSDNSTQSYNGATASTESQNPLEQLIEMGFCNRALNERLLRENKGEVAAVVAELVNMDDNDWYASRLPDSASID